MEMSEKVVLLVEDNDDDRELTLRSFQKNGIANKVIVARNGVEALDYLFCKGAYAGRKIDETPALILLDLKLPKLNGLEVLREIRSNPYTKRTPVVILTSSNEEKDKIATYELGAKGYQLEGTDNQERYNLRSDSDSSGLVSKVFVGSHLTSAAVRVTV